MFRATFVGLDRRAPVQIHWRRLPHWRQAGATYFVTGRLADSIPAAVVAAWAEQRSTFMAAHGLAMDLPEEVWRERYLAIPAAYRRGFERRQARQLHTELDRCHGACLFRDPSLAWIVADALRYFGGTRLHCGDFVVMPNHFHWLVTPAPGNDLGPLLASVKRSSATRLNRCLGRSGALWQHEDYDHIVRSAAELARIRAYIAGNPQQAQLAAGKFLYVRGAEYVPEPAG